jgi:xanthine dehydrogenase accessory factor
VTSFISREPGSVRLDTSLELLLERGPAGPTPCALATVVATAGSTYRKPGARMMIMADGSYLGLLSGGCLEADLLVHAREVIESGATRAIEYDMRGPDDILFGIGAGCEGAMRVLLEPGHHGGPAARALAQAGAITRSGAPACLVSIHESTEFALGTYRVESLPPQLAAAADSSLAERSSREIVSDRGSQRLRAFVQYLAPPPHVLLCGAGPDAQPVAAAARALGWRVSVVDHRPAYADAQRFPGAHVMLADAGSLPETVDLTRCHAVVVMSHHLSTDIAYLHALGAARAPSFVGLLGPPARRQRILRELGPAGEALRERLRGPVGIDIGAVTPEGIALAIVGEVHAWLAERPVVALSQQWDPEPALAARIDVSRE